MKKLILIIVSLILFTGFAACSSDKNESPAEKASQNTVTDESVSETQAENDKDKETLPESVKEDKKTSGNKSKETENNSEPAEVKITGQAEKSEKSAESKASKKSESTSEAKRRSKFSETLNPGITSADKKPAQTKNESGVTAPVTQAEQRPVPQHLIINSEPFTVTSKDGFDNAGVTCFICDETSMYSFKSGGKKVKWEVYVLAREFTDGARYLPQAHTPDLTGDGELKIEHGRYIYILCGESSMTADKASDAFLRVDYSKEKDLSGTYNDSVSKRARANLDDSGETVDVVVSWSSSAEEGSVWRMTCKKEGDRLVYFDCEKTTYSINDSQEDVSVVEFKDGKGYFTVSGDTILWDGASEEYCKKCVFEKKQAKQ